LRNAPRQQRARRRVEELLDAAAEVFDEVGYDKATTSEVAERAGVSPGTFYRWFPDKATLADALAERYLEDLGAMYQSLLGTEAAGDGDPAEPAADLVSRVIDSLTDMATTHPALGALLASAIAPANPSPAGQRLRADMHAQLVTVLDLRVPGIEPVDRDRVARVLLDVALTLVSTVAHLPEEEQAKTTREYVDLILAYLDAKFPPPDDPSWDDPTRPVQPLQAAPQVGRDAPPAP